jgi:tetratricopeptide (TPR) repeat protein
MRFRDEFLSRNRTYAEWSLEKTARAGFATNQERLIALQKSVKSTFEQGIDRLVNSQSASTAALRGELAYQAERIGEQISQSSREIVSAIEEGSSDIVDSIQQMSDYLGSELCEVRWAVERHTVVSEKILRVMLDSLGNESRQYFEQGVRCYETNENDFARERFSKALEANRTNHFAYQYLGFVAVAEDNSNEAIRNFDLACKFAETGYYKALALSHLARSYHALGDDKTAANFAKSATISYPDTAKFWYELASYNALLGHLDETIRALKEAIKRDWTYWAVVSSDKDFDRLRFYINNLLDELRESERQKARQAINELIGAINSSKDILTEGDISNFSQKVSQLEAQHSKNNVFVYLNLVPRAKKQRNKVSQAREQRLRERAEQERQEKERIAQERAAQERRERERIAQQTEADKHAKKRIVEITVTTLLLTITVYLVVGFVGCVNRLDKLDDPSTNALYPLKAFLVEAIYISLPIGMLYFFLRYILTNKK